MQKHPCRWLSLTLTAVLSAPTLAQAPDWKAFDAYVADAAQEWGVPGLAIAVVKDGSTVFAKGYGTTALTSGTVVDEHTLFSIGSTTKAMTAAALGLLVDEGNVAWDDPVVQHLPSFRLADDNVTRQLRVRDLLTHNAGVPNTDLLWYEQVRTTDDILGRLRFVEPVAPPYTTFVYQNVMYAAAGRLTEIISGQSWADFIDESLFTPLGMERSVALLQRTRQRDNVAEPHHLVDGELVQIENASVDSVAAAGSVWSSVAEMAEWAKFLLRGCRTAEGKALLTEATCDELFEPQALIDREMYPAMRLYENKWFTYGLGWFQTDYNGRNLDFHSGSIDGLIALHGLVRDEGLGVIVLANRDHAEVRHALMYRALDLFDATLDPAERRDWNREIKDLFDGLAAEATAPAPGGRAQDPRPPLAHSAYRGTFSDPFLGDVIVSVEGDGLILRFGRQTCDLESLGGDIFDCRWQARWRGGGTVSFVAESPGRIGSVKFAGRELRRRP